MQGKPTISFMPRHDMATKYGRSAAISQKLAHFHDLWGNAGVIECHEDNDLPNCMRQLLVQAADPDQADAIRTTASHFVVMDGPRYGQRVADLADDMVAQAALQA